MRKERYVPERYYAAPQSKSLMDAMENRGAEAAEKKEEFLSQLNVQTATWGLDLWEKQYGIRTDRGLTYDQRRSRVMSKMRGAGTATVDLMKNVAESYANGEVRVKEEPEAYRFTVEMISQVGIPSNFEGMKAALEEIKPAHLAMEFFIRFHIWKTYLDWTWKKAAGMTWLDMQQKGQ